MAPLLATTWPPPRPFGPQPTGAWVRREHVVLAALALVAVAWARPARAGPAEDEAALRQLSADWMRAIADKDQPALEQILAAEFALRGAGDPPSEETPRDEWLTNAIGKDWSGFRYENLHVQLDGDHATVTSHLAFHVAPIPFELDAGVVDTWARRDGRWQVTGRYLGGSRFQSKVDTAKGLFGALIVGVAIALVRRLRRR